MTAHCCQKPGRDALSEIDWHDCRIKAMMYDFVVNPRLRREIEAAIRQGPLAVFDLLDQIAYEQDLADAAAMIEGVADNQPHHPDTTRQVLGDALALIAGVWKAVEEGSLALQRRRP